MSKDRFNIDVHQAGSLLLYAAGEANFLAFAVAHPGVCNPRGNVTQIRVWMAKAEECLASFEATLQDDVSEAETEVVAL